MASKLFAFCFFTAILLPSNLAASIAASLTCPITHNECICAFNSPFYGITCKNIENESALEEITRNMTVNALSLQIKSVKWNYFPLDTLSNASLHTLIVQNSSFYEFSNISEVNVNSEAPFPVKHVSLENVTSVKEWQWKQLSPFENLQVLFMYNTTIGDHIPTNFSEYLSSELTALTIAESNITRVEGRSFEKLHNLTYLRISHGKLTTFYRNTLPVPSNLQQLRLDYNKIHTLPCDIFSDMPNLNVVSLSNNTISSLSEEVFSPLWKPGMHLELRDNPIKCDCRLLWTVTSETKPENVIGQCTHPKRLFGKNIKDLTVEDLTCSE